MSNDIALPIGQEVFFPGLFDVRVMLEEASMLQSWYECRSCLPDGCPVKACFPFREAASLAKSFQPSRINAKSANPREICLLIEDGHISGWLIPMTAGLPLAFRGVNGLLSK